MPDHSNQSREPNVSSPYDAVSNAYCRRLNLPVPCVEIVAATPRAKLFHLMVATLLERGEPMPLEAIAKRLRDAGVTSATGDMNTSLLKSWRGSKAVYRDDRGFFAPDLNAYELRSVIFRLNLRPTKRPPVDQEPKVDSVPDDVALAEKEVRAAFKGASESNFSKVRRIAAVLDVHGTPMAISEIEHRLSEWGSSRNDIKASDLQRWKKPCVTAMGGDLLQIDRQSPHLVPMRQAVRKLAERPLRVALVNEQMRQRRQQYEAQRAVEREREQAAAKQLRRAVLRVIPETGSAAAAALVDAGRRVVRSFIGPELHDLTTALQEYDLIAALGPRECLYALGIRDHDRWRLVDLRPPQKSRQLNRAGRKLTVTPELLISSSTGITRPLGDPAKIAGYLADGEQSKLRRRLESDAKSLFAFYNYGVLHRHVRLRWGFLNDAFAVDWAEPGDPLIHDALKECLESGAAADIVLSSAPAWSEPWSRAIRVRVVFFDYRTIMVQGDNTWTISRDEVQAIRIVEPASLADDANNNPQ